MKIDKLNIGFTFNRANGGPSNFLKNLKKSLKNENISNTSYYINPFTSCNIYANVVRNPWNRPYFFRVDGVGFDKCKSQEEMDSLNSSILSGIKNAKGVIYQSEFSKKLAEKTLGYVTDKSTTIINGTNQEIFNEIGDNRREKLGIAKDALVFITSARWRPRKRLKDTVAIFKDFAKKYVGETYLIVVGIENNNNNNNIIIYIPHIDNSELPFYLRTADIYLFLGWLDPCPNSVVEAISCGLPTICTNIGGTREIVNLTNGGIVVDTDPEYNYGYVYLDKPPLPNHKLILDAINTMTSNLSQYKKQIDKSKIDIKYVAKKYYEFINQEMQGKRKN
jgi:glycosyltransferase involved in cell wall biosynthesis